MEAAFNGKQTVMKVIWLCCCTSLPAALTVYVLASNANTCANLFDVYLGVALPSGMLPSGVHCHATCDVIMYNNVIACSMILCVLHETLTAFTYVLKVTNMHLFDSFGLIHA